MSMQISAEVLALWNKSQKVEAIKLMREQTGLGLKDTKDLLEAYAEGQLVRDTGGPKDLDMLMSVDKLRTAFPSLEPLLLREVERDVHEGCGHTGRAQVVQFIGRKPAGSTS